MGATENRTHPSSSCQILGQDFGVTPYLWPVMNVFPALYLKGRGKKRENSLSQGTKTLTLLPLIPDISGPGLWLLFFKQEPEGTGTTQAAALPLASGYLAVCHQPMTEMHWGSSWPQWTSC